MLTKGGFSLFEKDMIRVMQLLIDIEMKIFRDLNVKVIFLQNIVTDLLLGFGVKDVFIAFSSYIKEKYGVEPGFVTLNMPKLVEFLSNCKIENPIICSAINKAGYFMNPNKETYVKSLRQNNFRPIAMSILASGAIKPEEAVEYICRQPAIKSIVFGASSKQHIVETKELIESYSQAASGSD
jgi:phosphoribosylformimino-5-aminoimidazole carboxamide ribonucleotide (ProFAR) isomerase